MSSAARVAITGAGRGLGRALALEFSRRGWRVVGLMRDPANADAALSAACEALVRCDLSDTTSFDAAALSLRDRPLDCLIHNAAIRGDTGGLPGFSAADFAAVMQINVAAPLLLTRALLPLLPPAARIAFISSRAGSMAEGADPDGDYAYVASKAALNRLMVKLSQEMSQTVFALHPGWVRTDMGGVEAEVEARISAQALVRLIEASGPEETGSFRAWDGVPVMW